LKKRLVIGTRASKLAVWQTRRVVELLSDAWLGLECETRRFDTRGDRMLDKPLPEIGGKGLFTLELEEGLRSGEIDAAVHSLKDLPVEDAPGLTVGAVAERADAGDCVVAQSGWTLETLPRGAIVGTSSLRRRAQLLSVRPDLDIRSIRGNVETRIRKVIEGRYHAAVLARAGVERLGLADHITERLGLDVMIPAPGQGALAVQCRKGDEETLRLVAAIDVPDLRAAVTAERVFLEELGGGCTVPVGAFALARETAPPWKMTLVAVVASPDAHGTIRLEQKGDDPVELGRTAANEAIARGASDILLQVETVHRPPLEGRRVVVTRAGEQAAGLYQRLVELGADPILAPTIRIAPVEDGSKVDAVLTAFVRYQWVVFTSVNGVEVFWQILLAKGLDSSIFAGVKTAAVGTATARALTDRGVAPDFVPAKFVGEEIAKGLDDVSGKRVCLLRADNAGKALVEILQSRGADVEDVAIYRTLPDNLEPAVLEELKRGVDIVTVTSGSTVRAFVSAMKTDDDTARALPKMRFACIGPVTADAARELGLDVVVVAETHTTDGLADALIAHFEEEKGR
jgi:hydroxymethylbilane synthase